MSPTTLSIYISCHNLNGTQVRLGGPKSKQSKSIDTPEAGK